MVEAETEARFGEAIIRLVRERDGFRGTVALGDEIKARDEGQDGLALWRRLHVAAARLSPGYLGYDGAKALFLKSYPGGFQDGAYVERQRKPIVWATHLIDQTAPLGEVRSSHGFGGALNVIFAATNLVPPFEKKRATELLEGPYADEFIAGAAKFADDQIAAGIAQMTEALKFHDALKWPVATYLPFVWISNNHAFLRPSVALDYAGRVGHPFRTSYVPQLDPAVYEEMRDLVRVTEAAIADLKPRDRFDVQIFMWHVGAARPTTA